MSTLHFVRNSVQISMFSFLKLKEYSEWYDNQTVKIRAQIDNRLEMIREHGHFGHVRRLSSELFEIKFNNGNRIYCTEKIINGKTVILILGGNKNGQEKDIKKAQKAAQKIHHD
jgi:putative addiction module killer protein